MNAISKLIVAASVAATPMMGALAADNPTGPYVGVGAGQFNLKIDSLRDVPSAVSTIRDSDDNAWKGFVGYRFLPFLGVEAAYINLGRPGDRFNATGSNGNYDVKVSGFAASLIGTVPIGPVELFGKVGQYYYDVDTHIDLDSPGPDVRSKHSQNDFVWGGGVSLVVLQRLELRGEYERFRIDEARNSNAFWLDAAWRF
jgi:opacity protein-like surface antigen